MLPFNFWQDEHGYLAAVLRPRLQALALSGAVDAVQKLQDMGIHIDDDLVNADAATWARQYTDAILDKLGVNTQKMVGPIIANWVETPGQTMGDLEKALAPVLDDNAARAFRVSITETTRAVNEGYNLAHMRAGIPTAAYMPPAHPNCFCHLQARRTPSNVWVQVWYTNNDEKVCHQELDTPWGSVEGCAALHGVVVSEGEYLGHDFSEVSG